jgi:CubicO group peptidase (beta-lactamase class C family)
MTSSFFTVQEAQQKPDFSLPYREEKDEVHEIPFYDDFEGIAPAGAIVSNVLDMSKWLLLHLNKGKLGDTQIISEPQLTLMHSPQMVIPDPRKHKEVSSTAYGLGWAMTTYRGHYMLQHSGGIDGFSALATLLPDDNIGIVALSNMSGCPVHNIVTLNACDRLLGTME